MSDLTFVTGNTEKYKIARTVFAQHSIKLIQSEQDIDEIQSEDARRIVQDKLDKAFQLTKRPVVVNDDSWSIPGLGGFPGPYMKSIVHWFTAGDFLRLTQPLEDRRIILSQWIGYRDAAEQKLFHLDYTGTLLPELRGNYGLPFHKLVSMPGDDGLTIAEAYDKGIDELGREVAEGWQQFINWYKQDKI